jgi:hypothetical protein
MCKRWGNNGEIIPTRYDKCNGRGIVPSRASGEAARGRRGWSVHIHFD